MKILLIVIFIFSLVSCWKNENKENNISWESISKQETIEVPKITKDIKDMGVMEMQNSLYWNNWWVNLKDKIDRLYNSWTTVDDKIKLVYLQSFVWNYTEAVKYRKDLCKKNKEFCTKNTFNIPSKNPVDTKWNKIDNVSLFINWEYKWILNANNSVEWFNNFVYRLKMSKKWYADFYDKHNIWWNTPRIIDTIQPKFLAADSFDSIESSSEFKKETENFTFQISPDSFVFKNWKKVTWKIDVYFFDITSADWDLSVLNLDAFDSDTLSFEWWAMITFWMPLVKAYKWDEELRIVKPIVWQWKLQGIDKKAPWIDLVNVPKWEFLWKTELLKYNIPPFWNLNQDTWVWYSSKMKILDWSWSIEFELK